VAIWPPINDQEQAVSDRGTKLVRDIMSTRLHTVTPRDDLATALHLMSDHGVRRLPVVREDRGDTIVVGMLSDRDVRLAANSPFLDTDVAKIVSLLHEVKVADVMTEDFVSVAAEAPVASAAELMLEHHFGGLPVVEWEADQRFLVGMVTRSDMLARLIELETETEEATTSD
jgi:CBS domain-containing protein